MKIPPPKRVKEACDKFSANYPVLHSILWVCLLAFGFFSFFFREEMKEAGRGALPHIFNTVAQPVTINTGLFAIMLLCTILKIFEVIFRMFKKNPPSPSPEEVRAEIASLRASLNIPNIQQPSSPMVEASLSDDQKELLKEFALSDKIEWDTNCNSLGWFAPRFLQAMYELNQRHLVGDIKSVIPRDEKNNPGLQGVIRESVQRSLNKKVTGTLNENGRAAARRLGFIS